MRRHTLEAGLVGLAACTWYLTYARIGLMPQDEGWLLQGAQRVASGQTPYVDFTTAYVPGRYYLVAAILKLFGPDIVAVRILFVGLRAMVVVLVWVLGRRLAPRPLALAAAGLVLALPGPHHKTFYALVPLLVLALAAAYGGDRRRRWLLLAGAAAGLGAWLRQDSAAAGLAGALVTVLFVPRAGASGSRGRDAVLLGGAAALAFLVPAAWLATRGVTPGDLFRQGVTGAAAMGRPEMLGDLATLAAPQLAAPHRFLVPLLAWCVPGLAVAVLVAFVRAARRGDGAVPPLLGGLAVTTLLLSNQVFRFDPLIRILQCGPVVYVLFFAGLARIRPSERRSLLVAPVALAAYVLAFDGNRTFPVEYTGTVAVRARELAPLDVRGHELRVARPLAAQLGELTRFLSERTEPGEPILVLGKPVIAHFLVDRPDPTRRIRHGFGHRDDLDGEFWEGVRGAGCRHVVVAGRWTAEDPFGSLPAGQQPEPVHRIGPWIVWGWP